MVTYTSSVIPIIVAVWLQSYLEHWLNKVLPSWLRNFTTPLLVLLIMVPLTLLTVGPVTSYAAKRHLHRHRLAVHHRPVAGRCPDGRLLAGVRAVRPALGLRPVHGQ